MALNGTQAKGLAGKAKQEHTWRMGLFRLDSRNEEITLLDGFLCNNLNNT